MAEITDPHASVRRSAGTISASNMASVGPFLLNDPPAALRCCCGQTGCIFLQHNCSILESVENDVRTAAKLGQSLLERHEAYMADAERDRAELISRIGRLEMDKMELEAENARKIEENRALLDQLETLNTTVADSDTRVQLLEVTLQSSQQTVRRLEHAAQRAEDMERHLAALEAEQASLQNCLINSESEARSAIQRWRRAERGIADLQFQLEKMEKETAEERERHMEIMGRMERQRAVEKELSTAAGRLKGAAAAKSLQDNRSGGSGVVTHFVRDLMQDNATLQLGIAELRNMLVNSNDEIQLLRDQLLFHQPLDSSASATSTLRAELEFGSLPESQPVADMTAEPAAPETPAGPSTPFTPRTYRHSPSTSQEFHIHHHYHVKRAEPKRAKKKRLSLTPSVFTPPITVPSTPLSRSLSLYQDSASVMSDSPSFPLRYTPQHTSRDSVSTAMSGLSTRWSVFSDPPSDFAMSSVPSSPRTNPHNSLFDRSGITDLSLPSSPTTSVDPMSPTGQAGNRMQEIDESAVCGFPPSLSMSLPSNPSHLPLPIIEDEEHAPDVEIVDTEAFKASTINDATVADEASHLGTTTPTPTQDAFAGGANDAQGDRDAVCSIDSAPSFILPRKQRGLHRSVSHESIVSLRGGLDIHTLQTRPSQLALRPLGTPSAALADTGVSSITARPVLLRGSPDVHRSNAMLRDSLGLGLPALRAGISSSPLGTSPGAKNTSATVGGSKGLSRLVAWRPWGGNNGTSPSSTPPGTADSNKGSISSGIVGAGNLGAARDDSGAVKKKDTGGKDADASSRDKAPPSTSKALQGLRAPGINQPGLIPGFWSAQPRKGAPSKVQPEGVDQDALQEGLQGQ